MAEQRPGSGGSEHTDPRGLALVPALSGWDYQPRRNCGDCRQPEYLRNARSWCVRLRGSVQTRAEQSSRRLCRRMWTTKVLRAFRIDRASSARFTKAQEYMEPKQLDHYPRKKQIEIQWSRHASVPPRPMPAVVSLWGPHGRKRP